MSGGNLRNVAKRNGELTTLYPDLKLDYIYVTAAARRRLTDSTAFVVRPEYYGETGPQFAAAHSDHLPVLVDYAITDNHCTLTLPGSELKKQADLLP